MEEYFYLGFKDNNFINDDGSRIDILKIDKKLNILVGENNSGKSRLLKQFLNANNKSIILYYVSDELNFNRYFGYIYDEIYNHLSSDEVRNDFRKNYKLKKDLDLLYYCINIASKYKINIENYVLTIFNYVQTEKISSGQFIYIPILRGNENFDLYFPATDKLNEIEMTIPQHSDFHEYLAAAKTIYKNKLSRVYNIKEKNIFTAEELYDEIVDILLGREEKRNKLHEFEEFINDMFYESRGFHINPDRNKGCLLIKIGNETEYEIHNMGEGIKQLITILYPIFMNKDKKMYFFIEEPEINLHPGFQRKLMEILLSDEFSKHTFLINTHSNHIVDIINFNNNVALYKFNKDNKRIKIKKIDSNFITALNDLGVNASSSMLANSTIWVEGISDRIYIKKYLEMYFKIEKQENVYKEGIHYSFIEYAGSNITHYNFDLNNDIEEKIDIKYLSNNSFLIVDNDDTASRRKVNGEYYEKEIRKRKLEEKLGNNFFELKSREIENLIKLEILEKTLKEDNNLETLTRKKYLNSNEWRYNQTLISNSSTYMGTFIDETYNLNKNYKDYNSGTIRSKADFAIKVCKNINNWDDLSNQAKELAELVGNFIIKCNKR